MEVTKLSATKRTVTGRQVGQLRRSGQLPAVIYGPGTEPEAIQLNSREASMRVISDADEQVARVTFQTKEEDLSTPAGTTPTEVEVIEKGKLEEEGEDEAAPAKPEPAAKKK